MVTLAAALLVLYLLLCTPLGAALFWPAVLVGALILVAAPIALALDARQERRLQRSVQESAKSLERTRARSREMLEARMARGRTYRGGGSSVASPRP